MILEPIFERFINESPLSVMARALLENVLPASALDEMFERVAQTGYHRELLFSTTVELMSLVVCGTVPHLQSAHIRMSDRVPVTLKCVYEKLQRLELPVSAELVRFSAERCQPLIQELGGQCQPLLPGYPVKIIDGNHLAGTQKRLKVIRGHSAAALPGHCLVVLDPSVMLAVNVFPCEDAYTQERALLGQVLPTVQEGEVWIEDRNFCTVDFLLGIAQRRAFFVVRRHGNLTVKSQDEFGPEVETETGWVSERRVWICRGGEKMLEARLVRVRLKQPTEDGDLEVEILTNLPADVSPATVSVVYLKRWKIEGVFHELTVSLNCEVNTLGYPRAALFGFCVALMAYNVLAVLKAAIRSVHGEEKVEKEVSGYYMALEWATVYMGMMIAIPAPYWEVFGGMRVEELATHLREWAGKIKMETIKKSSRKPTKQKTKPIKDDSPHLSTARLLDEAKKTRAKQTAAKTTPPEKTTAKKQRC